LHFGFCHKAGKGFLAIDGLDAAAFKSGIATVEYLAHPCKRFKISRHRILDKLIRRTAGFGRPVIYLGLQIGGEMYFHALRVGVRSGGVKYLVKVAACR
jgi:hypothetical protein